MGELKTRLLKHKQTGEYLNIYTPKSLLSNCCTGVMEDLLEHAIRHRQLLSHVLDVSTEESSEGELAAMVSYAIAFPDGFMALVDTYDVKRYFAFRQILSERFLVMYIQYSFEFWHFS